MRQFFRFCALFVGITVLVYPLLFVSAAKRAQTPSRAKYVQVDDMEELDEEEEPVDIVDPREIKNEIRQTNDQLREVKRLLSVAKAMKAQKEMGELQQLQQTILTYQRQLKSLKPASENAREVLEEYRNAGIWDTFNDIRKRTETPKELRDIQKALTKLEKVIKGKTVQKALSTLEIDIEKLRALVGDMRTAYETAAAALAEGDIEAVDDALTDIRESGHPGEFLGIIQSTPDIARGLRLIRDQEIRAAVKELLQPVVDALNEGDIRGAQFAISELSPHLRRIMEKAVQISGKRGRGDFLKQVQVLEAKVGERLEAEEGKRQQSGNNDTEEKNDEGAG